MFGNYFYEWKNSFIPAELSLTKISLQNGVEHRFQTLLAPSDIHPGYRYEAKAHADSTHHLPLPPNALGVTNFHDVYTNVRGKLPKREFDGGKPMVFTCFNDLKDDDDSITVIKSILTQISDDQNDIEVYSLSEFFYEMNEKFANKKLCNSIPNVNIARAMLRRSHLFLCNGLSCKYHEKNDNHEHCALAQGASFAFLVLYALCKPLKIERIEGKHKPFSTDASEHFSQVSDWPNESHCDTETESEIDNDDKTVTDTETETDTEAGIGAEVS